MTPLTNLMSPRLLEEDMIELCGLVIPQKLWVSDINNTVIVK